MTQIAALTVRADADIEPLSRKLARISSLGQSLGREFSSLGRTVEEFGVRTERGARRAEGAVVSLASRMRQLSRVGSTLRSVGSTLTVGAGLGLAAGGLTVNAATEMQGYRRSLEAVTGSAAEARVQLASLTEIAKLPGIGFREAIQGSVRLQAVGVSAATAERSLRGFANAVALTGGGRAELERITYQLGQLSAKGKVMANDIRPILEAAPAVGKAMREAFGTVDTEKIQKMNLTTEQFMDRLLTGLERLPQVSGSAKTSFENLSDALFRTRAAIGEALLPALVPLADGLASVLSNIKEINPNTVRWGASLAVTAGLIGPLIGAVGSLATTLAALRIAGLSLALTVGIGAPLLVGLAALSALFVKNKLDALAAASAMSTYRQSLRAQSEFGANQTVREIETMLARLRAERARLPERVSKTVVGGMGSAVTFQARNPRVVEIDRKITELNEDLRITRERIAEIRNETDKGPLIPPVITTPLTSADLNRLRSYREELEEIALHRRFGFTDAARSAISEVTALRNRIGDIRAQLTKVPDAAGQTLLGALTDQLDTAIGRVRLLAREFQVLQNREIKLDVSLTTTTRTGGNLSGPYSREGTRYSNDAITGLGGPLAAAAERFGAGVNAALASIRGGLTGLINVFNPLSLISGALSAAFQQAGPALEPLITAVGTVAGVLAKALMPILSALWPIFKQVVIGATYLGQIFFNVSGAILKAVGWLVRSIGKLVNLLPGSPGDPLVKAGQNMINLANGFIESAGALGAARDEIKALPDDLSKVSAAARNTSEALSNIPEIFDLQRRRMQASFAGFTSQAVPVSTPGGGAVSVPSGPTFNVTINNPQPGVNVAEWIREARRQFVDELRNPNSELSLAVAGA